MYGSRVKGRVLCLGLGGEALSVRDYKGYKA